MKNFYFLVWVIIAAMVSTGLSAQDYIDDAYPFLNQSSYSPNYGTDVLIQPNPGEYQAECRVSVASNGWIYASYMLWSGGLRVARSIDNGQTWTHTSTLRANYTLTALDLVVTGYSANSLKVWVINSGYNSSSIDLWEVSLEELNGDLTNAGSHSIESMFSNDGYYGVAIASDYFYPSAGTSPFSLAIIYSKADYVNDKIIFKTSSTGNAVFDNTQVVTTSAKYLTRVALAYGRSYAYPNGNYFAAWHKQQYAGWAGEYEGEIYTSFTVSQYNGTWIAPIRLDNLVESGAGNCKHPAIACQVNNTNNLTSGISTVVLFDRKYNQDPNDKNGVVGAYNLDPHLTPIWSAMTVESQLNASSIQPDVVYDTLQNNFYATWCDSTNQSLKCAYQSFNLPSPSGWSIFYSGYNDNENLKAPFPRVQLNAMTQQVVNVWTGAQATNNGNATFDASNIIIGVTETKVSEKAMQVKLSPNPATDHVLLRFESSSESTGNLRILNQAGQVALKVPKFIIMSGQNCLELDVSKLSQGIYFCSLQTDDENICRKLVIAR
jgi:hypothetical protein